MPSRACKRALKCRTCCVLCYVCGLTCWRWARITRIVYPLGHRDTIQTHTQQHEIDDKNEKRCLRFFFSSCSFSTQLLCCNKLSWTERLQWVCLQVGILYALKHSSLNVIFYMPFKCAALYWACSFVRSVFFSVIRRWLCFWTLAEYQYLSWWQEPPSTWQN